jgi:hypothetical protein
LAISPGSKFNRHGGSILNRRQHAGIHWKEQALEKVKAAAAREGLSLSDLHQALFGHGAAPHPTS